MKKRKTVRAKTKIQDLTHDTMPATVGLVKAVRDELKADIRALEHKMDSKFAGLDARFASIDARFASIDARFDNIDARFAAVDGRFEGLEAKIEKTMVSVHRIESLMEEQRGENRIVLDGIKMLCDRQDRLEVRMDELHHTVKTFMHRPQMS